MDNVKFPNSSLTIILSPGRNKQILYPKFLSLDAIEPKKLRTHGHTCKETNTNTINLVA